MSGCMKLTCKFRRILNEPFLLTPIQSFDKSLKTLKYHGQKRHYLVSIITNADIVLTTYHTLAADLAKKSNDSSPLHNIEWFRIVLDEGDAKLLYNVVKLQLIFICSSIALT